MNTKERIVMYLESQGLSVTVAERELGWSKSSLLKTTNVSADRVSEFLHFYKNLSAEWLLRGKGEMLKGEDESPIMNMEKGVPYYDVDFICGFDELENDQTRTPTCLIWFPKYERADCWCSVSGMSMYPDICPGDIIALKEIHDFTSMPYGEIYGIVTGEHRTVKRICKSDKEGYIRLVPTNKSDEYSPQDIPLHKVVKIYKVLAAVHKF